MNPYSEIKQERKRQNAKFGIQHRSLIEWCVILGEEVGEVNRAAMEIHFKDEYKFYNGDIKDFRKELIQVAAVCVQIIEDIDKT